MLTGLSLFCALSTTLNAATIKETTVNGDGYDTIDANDMIYEEVFDTFIKMLNDIYNNYGIYNKNNRLDFTFKELKEDRKSYSKHQNNKKILEDLQNTITNYLDNCTDEEWKKF